MASNRGITVGSILFIIGVIVIAFTIPHTHPQQSHVLKITASPNEVLINGTTTTINITVNYTYSFQNPEITIISPTVKVFNETSGQNFTYDIVSAFSETIYTQSYIKTTQNSETTLPLSINPGAYNVMGNSTYTLKIIFEDPSLTYQYGQANVTLLAS